MSIKPTSKSCYENTICALSKVFDPLITADDDLFESLGYEFSDVSSLLEPLKKISTTIQGLPDKIDSVIYSEDNKEKIKLICSLIVDVKDIVRCIIDLDNVIEPICSSLADKGLAETVKELPKRLLDRLIVDYLRNCNTKAYSVFVVFGIIEKENCSVVCIPVANNENTKEVEVDKIDWERLISTITEPGSVAKVVYKWGDDFDSDKLIGNLDLVLGAFCLPGGLYVQEKAITNKIRGTVENDDDINELKIPLYQGGSWPDSYCEMGINISPMPKNENEGIEKGLSVIPYIFGEGDTKFKYSTSLFNFILELQFLAGLDSGLGLIIRPPFECEVISNLFKDGVSEVIKNFGVTFRIETNAENKDNETLFFGSKDSTRFGWKGIKLALTIDKPDESSINVGWELGVEEVTLAICGGDGDGFLAKTLSNKPMEIKLGLTLGMSKERGFYIEGGAGFAYTFDVHKTLGPIVFNTVDLGLGFVLSDGKPLVKFTTAASLGLSIGPIKASIKKMGMQVVLDLNKKGLLGNADLSFGFKPPDGVGIAIDSEAVTGGGFLDFDHENKRYTGILTLKCGEIGITAIGLITTKMPDGSKGFSMLVNIGVTFSPPIQLSMGFTLSGVGGIIGVNRTIMIDVLRAGVKKHTLDSILFPEPEWVIPNAAKVISDLRAVFPPADGRFVIGPMVKIGYGSPNIIIADIGVFIELPKPIRIVLLGQLSMLLPDPKKAIVRINLDIVGVLDMEKKELSFQASLYDSGILKFELYGDAAFFLGWGAQPEFAMSLGGFHPRFEPPPPPIVFADLKRLGLNLSSGSNFQLSCGVYQALTPNSLQFGARADLYATACGAEITGFLSFDTLIYFSPFSFEIDLGAGVAIRFKGIDLAEIRVALNLSGPTPWNARGTATIKILCFDLDVEFHITWGREDAARLDPIDPWPQLEQALLRAESWGSLLPVAANMVESLRKIEEEPVEVADGEEPKPAPVIVHPAGTLEIRQNIAPLNCTLKKFGNAPVCKHDRFRITSLTTSDGASLGDESLDEFFSRGQFEKLSNSQKLSVPSFEKMPGGVKTKSSNRIVVQGQVRSEELCYESIVIKSDRTSARPKTLSDSKMAVSAWRNSRVLTAGNAYSRSALRNKGKSRFALKGGRLVKTAQEKYVIVDTDTLQTVTIDQKADIWSEKMTRTQAEQALAQHLTISSKEAQSLIVISEYEAEEVA